MIYTLFLALIMIVAVLLILIIMVQNPKGGGLSSTFGGGGTQALGGVQNTTSFLDKSTWTLSIVLLVLILLSNFAAPKAAIASTNSEVENTIDSRTVKDTPQPLTAPVSTDSVQK